MKHRLLTFAFAALLMGCETTTKTTTNSDGSTTTTRTSRQDPKVLKELEPVIDDAVKVGVQAGVNAAAEALRKQGNNGSPGANGDHGKTVQGK